MLLIIDTGVDTVNNNIEYTRTIASQTQMVTVNLFRITCVDLAQIQVMTRQPTQYGPSCQFNLRRLISLKRQDVIPTKPIDRQGMIIICATLVLPRQSQAMWLHRTKSTAERLRTRKGSRLGSRSPPAEPRRTRFTCDFIVCRHRRRQEQPTEVTESAEPSFCSIRGINFVIASGSSPAE